MAQRLATEYVKTTLTLSETQMDEFLQAVDDPQVHYRIKVLDNGGQEIVLEHIAGEEVHLFFEAKEGGYVCELTCRLIHPQLTLFIRKLFVRLRVRALFTGCIKDSQWCIFITKALFAKLWRRMLKAPGWYLNIRTQYRNYNSFINIKTWKMKYQPCIISLIRCWINEIWLVPSRNWNRLTKSFE